MIGIHDLHDISAAWIRIREDIYYDKNILILQKINQVLLKKQDYQANQIRNSIAEIPNLSDIWNYVHHPNVYVYDAILKDPLILDLLKTICDKLILCIQSKQYDLACDLADTVHCLPDIIAENKFSIPKSYWKSHVKYFRNKWDKDFLYSEQKMFK